MLSSMDGGRQDEEISLVRGVLELGANDRGKVVGFPLIRPLSLMPRPERYILT